MPEVDQDAGVRSVGEADDVPCRGHVGDGGERRELECHLEVPLDGGVTEHSEAIGGHVEGCRRTEVHGDDCAGAECCRHVEIRLDGVDGVKERGLVLRWRAQPVARCLHVRERQPVVIQQPAHVPIRKAITLRRP